MKKIKPHSQIASKAILGIVKSFRFNSQNYIPKEGLSFSLFRVEILSGLTVALALVPEAIAFAFVAGVAPLSGLYAAFIVGVRVVSVSLRHPQITSMWFSLNSYTLNNWK